MKLLNIIKVLASRRSYQLAVIKFSKICPPSESNRNF